MIPDRYRVLVEELEARAAETDDDLFVRIATFVVETTSSDFLADGVEEALGPRLDDVRRALLKVGPALVALEARLEGIDARISTLELAITETNRRLPSDAPLPEATKTIFTIPVVLAEGVDDKRILSEIAKLPAGLDGPAAVDELVKLGLVERAR